MMYAPQVLEKLSDDEILRKLQAHGHRGYEVDGETLATPGGAARIHALTHSWAENYPQVHWSPEDIQLMHELAVRVMQRHGFRHTSPIEPELEAAVERYGPEAWKGGLRGVRGVMARGMSREELLERIREIVRRMGGIRSGKRAIVTVDYPGRPIRVACGRFQNAVDLAKQIRDTTGYPVKVTTFQGRLLWPARRAKYRKMADEYNPNAGDKLEVYYDRRYGVVGYLIRPTGNLAFKMTPKQWARYKRFRGTRPIRIFTNQVLPRWSPKGKPIRR